MRSEEVNHAKWSLKLAKWDFPIKQTQTSQYKHPDLIQRNLLTWQLQLGDTFSDNGDGSESRKNRQRHFCKRAAALFRIGQFRYTKIQPETITSLRCSGE